MPGVYRHRPRIYSRPRRRWVGTAGAFQRAYASADMVLGGWQNETGGTTLFSSIDETTASDSDYIQSGPTPANDFCEVKFGSLGDPLSSNGHIISYRYEKDVPTNQIDLTVELRCATTVIASWVHNNVANSFVTATQVLTTAQADAITDYTNLRLRFSANQSA